MVSFMRKVYVALLIGTFSANVYAATGGTPGVQGGTTAKDNNDWTGDQVQIQGNLPNLKPVAENPSNPKKTFIAPAYTRFDVTEGKSDEIIIVPRDNFRVESTKVIVTPSGSQRLYNTLNFSQPWGDVDSQVNASDVISPFTAYKVNKSDIENNVPYVKYGWSFGAMLVPFKYQSKAKTIASSNSYQAYAQYKRASNGLADGPFISGGLSTADVATGAGSSDAKYGVSYGAGWIFEINKGSGFQLAIMLGQDRFGKSSGYQYEGETWYTFSIAYQPGDQGK